MTEKTIGDRVDVAALVKMRYRYEETRNDPFAWQQQAQLLREAANYLICIHKAAMEQDIDGVSLDVELSNLIALEMHRPALMMAAFAIEVLLKALLIKNGKSADIEHHDLGVLAKDAGLEEMLDRDVLQKLTVYSIWKGRYPTSKAKKSTPDHLMKQKNFIANALNLKNFTFGDLKPQRGLDLPNALYDHSATIEDYGGTLAIKLFDDAMTIYNSIYDEWRK